MFYTLFYLFTVADRLSTLFGWLCFFSTFGLLITSICTLLIFNDELDVVEETTPRKYQVQVGMRNLMKVQKILLVLCPLFWVFYIGTPTKKEAVLIVAGGYIGSFIQSDSNARALPADITRFLRAEINQAAREADLGSILEPTKIKEQRDSLSNLSKEQLVEGLLKKE